MFVLGKIISELLNKPPFFRRQLIILIDIFCINLSLWLSLFLTSNSTIRFLNLEYNFIALFSTILGPIIYIFSGQYKGIIRYPNSIQTLNIFLRNSSLIFIIYFSSFYFYESVPLNEFLIYLLVLTSIISCTRYF